MEKYAAEFKRWLASDKLTGTERAELLSIEKDESTMALRLWLLWTSARQAFAPQCIWA